MKKSGLWIPIAFAVMAIYAISEYGQVPGLLPWLSTEAKEILGHLVLYTCLGFLLTRYLWGMGLGLLAALPITLSLCGLLGIYDEFHQYFVGGRGVEFLDVAMDVVGGLAGALAYAGWALLGKLIVKSPRPELRANILLRHGIVALTFFVFILVPATIYWVPITKYVEERSTECSAFAEEVVRIWAPQALSKQAQARSGRDWHEEPASRTKVLRSEGEKTDSNEELLQFIQVANMLSEKNNNSTGPAVRPTSSRGSKIGKRQ